MEAEVGGYILAAITAIGSVVKMYFDYKTKKDALDRANHAEEMATQIELAKIKAEAAVRANVVGLERVKSSLGDEASKTISQSIHIAAEEEDAAEYLKSQVFEITKESGTRFFNPKKIGTDQGNSDV
jgi:hypothetical protein